jgi:hypothetical protein
MPEARLTLGVELAKPAEAKWREILDKIYDAAYEYEGKCTYEHAAFLADFGAVVRQFFGISSVEEWAKAELPKRFEEECSKKNLTPLRIKIYLGEEPILWGLAKYPAVRVESWHASPPIPLIPALLAVLGVLAALGIILHFLFQDIKELPWEKLTKAVGLGVAGIALLVFGALALAGRRRE